MSVVAFKEKSRVLAELSLLVAAALFFSSTVSAPALAQTVPFSSRLDFAVEAHPTFVAVGDFNGDRVQDLAVTNFDSNTISVLLGNGDGTFRAAPTIAAGSHPFAVAVGARAVPFRAPLDFAVGAHPASVAVGDFNGDRVLDLAVANYDSTTVSVLLGNGDGTFRTPLTFDAGAGPASVAVGDFNGDG